MIIEQLVRAVFLILAFGIFLYQMKQSIGKYIEPPVMQTISMIKVNDLPQPPKFYVCLPFDQVNNIKAKEYGYTAYYVPVHLGMLTNGSLSWSGQYGNSTFKEIIDDVYNFNYTSLISEEIRNGTVTNVTRNISFLFPSGFCNTLNFEGIPSMGWIGSETAIRFSISDPMKVNNLRTEETPEARVTLEGPEKFEWKRVEVKYELHDATIRQGITCTDYLRHGSSYGWCIKKALKTKLFDVYGCMPPWMVTDNDDRFASESSLYYVFPCLKKRK